MTWEQAVLWLRRQSDKKELVKDCYYDDPIEVAADRYFSSDEWNTVKQIVGFKFPCNVLDIGAGRGMSSYAFAKENCKVTALEPDRSKIVGSGAIKKLFEEKKLPISIVEDFGEKLPFEDNSFDIVYGRAVLHHAKDIQSFCNEACRVLKNGGLLFLTREHVVSKKNDLDKFFQSHTLHKLYGGENAYLLKEYRNAIIRSGLRIKKTLSPFATPINYAPMSKEQANEMVKSIIRKRCGENQLFSKVMFNIIKRLFVLYNSHCSHIPGRLYSFLARKE